MLYRLFIFIVLIASFGCDSSEKKAGPKKGSNKKVEENKVEENRIPDNFSEANIGNYLYDIEFKVTASLEEMEIFEDGIVPWISFEYYEEQIDRLIAADSLIVPFKKAEILIDYPLGIPVYFELKSDKNGFTRRDLIVAISKKYKEIYEEEELTAQQKTIAIEKRTGLVNRNTTDGKYKICCHDLSDLDLSGISLFKVNENLVRIVLYVES